MKNKTILITGGTGSFGQRMTEELLTKHDPKKVIIYSRDELKQFDMNNKFCDERLRFFLGDVRDKDRLILATKGVDYIIHAAALKQVPASEYNPMEFIKTNVLGAQNVTDAALVNKVKKTIALSTDKAANPINLYGATKLTSDKIFITSNNVTGKHDIRFSVVRYGNVINSRGSVVPYFKKLVEQGNKFLPITDMGMTRFFLTLDQGIKFVLNCFKNMRGGEIYIPKIPSAKIKDVAHAIAPDIPLQIIGIRPGEKLHEVMLPKELAINSLEYDKYYVIYPCEIVDTGFTSKRLKRGFEYCSGSNDNFLDVEGIKALI